MNLSRLVLLPIMTGLLVFAPSPAHADLPPPDGMRRVEYRFRVDGIAKQSPDHMIVVYPWSMSNGVPTREQTTAPDGQWVSFGRRSAPPELYAVRKAAYEAFLKTYVAPENFRPDPAIDAFLAKAAKCNLAPKPEFTIPTGDSRSAIEEVFVAQKISDTSCILSKEGSPATNAPEAPTNAPPQALANAPEAPANAPPEAPANAPVAPANAGTAPKSGGCAGCTVGDKQVASGVVVAGLLMGTLAAGRRRKRR